MGLTLIAVLTAALLLPGIVAARAFYQASKTAEVEPSIPPLSSTDGIALVGLFSIAVHLLFVVGLKLVSTIPSSTQLPLADPYLLFTTAGAKLPTVDAALPLFLGLGWLCAVALVIGFLSGKLVMRFGDRSIFYGPLADIIAQGDGDHRFIAAYVVTKLRHERRAIGYRGTVVALTRDADRLPSRLVLKDAVIFYLDFDGDKPVRREQADLIAWLTLSASDWENLALRVFEVVEDDGNPSPAPSRGWALLGLILLAVGRGCGASEAPPRR